MIGRGLFRKYAALLAAIVAIPLVASGGYGIWTSYRLQKTSMSRLQHEQAQAAAARIAEFVSGIDTQLRWVSALAGPATTMEQRRFAIRLLLRQAPPITTISVVDAGGREDLMVSRLDIDVLGSGADRSRDLAFAGALGRRTWHGPVYFRGESEPTMTVAVAGTRRDAGVVIAEVNLKFIRDVVTQIRAGDSGRAYVVDATGRLIAHPDLGLVLRKTDYSGTPQFAAALRDLGEGIAAPLQRGAGSDALIAHAVIAALGWIVFVEMPAAEAYAPVYASLVASAFVLLLGLVLAVAASFFLARRLVSPIRKLHEGAARIGQAALDHRIHIDSGDELEALGDQFNRMADQLQQSYALLERKVDQRTRELQLANLARSRFIAAASHDLRQPLHALGLFINQLRDHVATVQGARIVDRIHAATAAMNELFNALLDMSKLDAQVLEPKVTTLPLSAVFARLETTFSGAAREKRLLLRVRPTPAWVCSDFILLERILLNLVSNALRYTDDGGVLVAARQRNDAWRIDVVDTGRGIAPDQLPHIFAEFYQGRHGNEGGLGLGLAIVDRLSRLLGHPVEVRSVPGRGSRFSITVPRAAAQLAPTTVSAPLPAFDDPCVRRHVLVIDDDALVRDGMRGLLERWSCRVTAVADSDALESALAGMDGAPDIVISDYRLPGGKTGFDAIARVREFFGETVPALLVSGDTSPERLQESARSGFQLLHKPVPPHALRAVVSHLLRTAGDRRDRTVAA